MFSELGVDRVKFVDWIALVRLRHIHQMKQQASALDVPQELNSKTMTEMGAFNKAGNIRNNEGFIHIQRDNTKLGFQGRKWILGYLWARRGNARYQRGLTRIRITH